jgi:hypothetical protein
MMPPGVIRRGEGGKAGFARETQSGCGTTWMQRQDGIKTA